VGSFVFVIVKQVFIYSSIFCISCFSFVVVVVVCCLWWSVASEEVTISIGSAGVIRHGHR